MKKVFLLIILFSFSFFSGYSQNNLTKTNKDKKFTKFDTKKPDKYGEDLVKYFEDYKQEDIQKIITDFVAAYNSYPLDKKNKIINTSNIFIKKRASKSPHFTNYFKLVMLISDSGQSPENYNVLESMIKDLMVKKRQSAKTVNDLIEALLLLYEDEIMFSNRGRIDWTTTTKDFKLVFNKELFIEFGTTDLMCQDPSDSLIILQTSGVYNVKKALWKGKGGKVSWEKTGLPANQVYAELNNYTIDLKRREYAVKNVDFYHSKYFAQPIKGDLEDKLQRVSKPEDKTYPRFVAENSEVSIKDVLKGVDYRGPFTMRGSGFIGVNGNNDYGYVEVKKQDTTKVYARSNTFVFKPNLISGKNTRIHFPLADSTEKGQFKGIYHPSVAFYVRTDSNGNNRLIEATRTEDGLGKSLFYNTFHNLEMDFEQISWKIDEESKLDFRNLQGAIMASGVFKTLDNFAISDYYKMQLTPSKNALTSVEKYAKLFFNLESNQIAGAKLDAKGIARYLKITETAANQMLLRMAIKGYIEYDPETGEGKILERLPKYLAMKRKKLDYDIITINSQLDSANAGRQNSEIASLDLNKRDLTINNVLAVPLSSVHNVVCIPDSSAITMQENRNFTFNGTLRTEFLEFIGSGFEFKFEDFKFDLNQIDFLKILIRGTTDKDTFLLSRAIDRNGFYYPEGNMKKAGILKERVYRVVDENGNKTDTLIKKEVVKSRIEKITGELLIDHPSNKAGSSVDSFPEYPKFICNDTAFVYYDKYYEEDALGGSYEEPILDKKYDRDKFYFMISPFKIDSIGRFTANSWRTPGIFHSSIFKDFSEDLTIIQDTIRDKGSYTDSVTIYSLGFIRPDHKEYAVYPGVGKEQGMANNALKLSNKGLRGVGYLEYLTAKLESSDFVYFPDFMVTDAYNTIVREQSKAKGTEYASSLGRNNFIEWIPAKDTMIISSGLLIDSLKSPNWKLFRQTKLEINQVREPIEMYNGQAVLTGQSIITPDAHVGWGTMEFSNSELSSKYFEFRRDDYNADTADFLIKPTGFITPAFTAFNVNSHISYINRIGKFRSNGDNSEAFFPVNQFKTYMDKFDWDIDKNEIMLGGLAKSDEDKKKKQSEYVSTNPTQDSLRFMSYSAGYSLEDFVLRCYEVDSIIIANGTVFPDTTIVIRENAEIDPLYNTLIKADNTNRYHVIRDAIVTLLGRYAMKGEGMYDYFFVRETEEGKDSSKFVIKFDKIIAGYLDSTYNDKLIRCYGKINPEKQIDLSEQFLNYKGIVELHTNEQYLRFKGSVELNNQCDTFKTENIVFEGNISPDSVVIEYTKEPTNSMGRKINAGFFSTTDSVYTSFLSQVRHHSDIPFFADTGILYYSKELLEYTISSKEKYLKPDTIGNILAFNNRYCYMTADGNLNLGANLGQVELRTIGRAKHNFATDEISINNFMAINFYFNKEALKIITDEVNTSISGIDPQSDAFTKGVKHILGLATPRTKELYNEFITYGQFKKIPPEFNKTFVFSNVNLKWNSFTSSYQSDGVLNIASINGEQVYKSIDGYIEIVKKKTGDELYILLEPNSVDWILFQYTGGKMFTVSSFTEYNKIIKEAKDNKQDVNKGEPFLYTIGNADIRKDLIERITGKQLNEEEPIDNIEETEDEDLEDEGFEGE